MARPREFDPETALDAVMQVFWCKGYEGTSLQDLEEATGLNKQSLYRIFEDKRGMYLSALDLYQRTEIAVAIEILNAKGAARTKFKMLFDKATGKENGRAARWGCFLCNASTDQALHDGPTRNFVQLALSRLERAFQDALSHSPAYCDNPRARKKAAAKLLAGYVGLRVLARASAPEAVLLNAAAALLADL